MACGSKQRDYHLEENATDDGVTYYFNTETMEKTFDKPEELMTEAELKNSSQNGYGSKTKMKHFYQPS